MWPSERLTELLGIEHPIIQAPMAGATTPALAAAAANGGGLGSLGCAFTGPEKLWEEIAELRSMTNRAFNLNFFVHAPPVNDPAKNAIAEQLLAPFYSEYGLGPIPPPDPGPPPFGEAQLQVVLEARPRVASFHFGLPAPDHMTALKKAGILVLSSATTWKPAARMRSSPRGGRLAAIAACSTRPPAPGRLGHSPLFLRWLTPFRSR
jgi:nitronate monooxygenase